MEARVLGGVEADVFKQILVAKLSTGFTRFTCVLYILLHRSDLTIWQKKSNMLTSAGFLQMSAIYST